MMRTFLTWLYAEGLITVPLARAVPGAYRRRRIRMPAALTEAAVLLTAWPAAPSLPQLPAGPA